MSRLVPLVLALLLPLQAGAFVVAIDPGHGGQKDGALSPGGVKEKDVSLQVALKLRALLVADGVKVVLTREDDRHVELQDRTAAANAAKADLLVSIHCNSMPTPAARKTSSGIETYFLSADSSDAQAHALAARENADLPDAEGPVAMDPITLILQDLSRSQAHSDSARLAQLVHKTLVKGVGGKSRGVRQAPFIVLLGAEMPAVLVEIGFISHPSEGKQLATPAYQEKIAQALRDGVKAYRSQVFAKRAGPEADVEPAKANVPTP